MALFRMSQHVHQHGVAPRWRLLLGLAVAVTACRSSGRPALGSGSEENAHARAPRRSGDAPAAEVGRSDVSGLSTELVRAAPTPPVPVPNDVLANVTFHKRVAGLSRPVAALVIPGDPRGALVVVEQGGTVREMVGDVVATTPVLDVSQALSTGNEQGLLGVAFHPGFATNRRLWISFTDRAGTTTIDEYRWPKGAPKAKRVATRFTQAQPYANHNGGHLTFAPDGALWLGLGDGGAAGDPHGHGQNRESMLGKMLRFAPAIVEGQASAWTPTIAHRGVRNPWRFAFDAATSDLWIADVGQNLWEQVYFVAAQGAAPSVHNFGWNIAEGAHCFTDAACDRSGFTAPVAEYGHALGCSVTGGVVYRGEITALQGHFFYGDFCTGLVRSIAVNPATGTFTHWSWPSPLPGAPGPLAQLAAFGTTAQGELLLVLLSGEIWQMQRRSTAPTR